MDASMVDEKSGTMYRYVLFLNPQRTVMATCWPHPGPSGTTWNVERAYRDSPAHTWGPPDRKGMTGDLASITTHFRYHGLTERELVS